MCLNFYKIIKMFKSFNKNKQTINHTLWKNMLEQFDSDVKRN